MTEAVVQPTTPQTPPRDPPKKDTGLEALMKEMGPAAQLLIKTFILGQKSAINWRMLTLVGTVFAAMGAIAMFAVMWNWSFVTFVLPQMLGG